VLVVVHEPHAGLGRLGDLGGLRLDERRPDLGQELPDELTGYHGLIVLGGSMAAWDDEAVPWLPHTRRLLAEAVERSLPTLAICLGAQLLALATGGEVRRGAAGPEIGVVEIELTDQVDDDALLGPVARLGRRPAVAHWHQDAVTRLPGGAVQLATGIRYPHQAFRLGRAAWGLQYHPEVSREDWADWMRNHHGAAHPEGLDRDALAAAMTDHEPQLAALATAHAAAFGDVVAGVVL
jgi:GMP synthase-like glutamine amidotransferase